MSLVPIGSDFELPARSLVEGDGYVLPPNATLLQSGRQALAAVAAALSTSGCRAVRVPEYLCDSMVVPFTSEGLEILPYPLDDDLEITPDAVQLDQGEAWLLAPYFGRHLPTWISNWATARSNEGQPVIVDQTHCVLSPDPTEASFTVASLRKVLPVPEGGYVTGCRPMLGDGRVRLDIASAFLSAAQAKSLALDSGNSSEAARRQFLSAEVLVETAVEPQGADTSTTKTLQILDVARLIDARRTNAQHLARALKDLEQIRPLRGILETEAPSFLTCQIREASALQAWLAERRIYCPIHWPRPASLPVDNWRRDLISLPIDHRYGVVHMQRIAAAVTEFLHLEA